MFERCQVMVRTSSSLHHIVLHAGRLRALHHVATSLIKVLDIGKAKWTTTILVARKLGDRRCCIVLVGEFDNACSARATVRLVLDFRTLDFTNRCEEFDQILVARAPGQLFSLVRTHVTNQPA